MVRNVMARVVLAPIAERAPHALPKLPQPFASDPVAVAAFLGVPVRAPEGPNAEPEARPGPETRATDELPTDLSPATITAIIDAAAEITTGGVSATWSPQPDAPPDAALERVIAQANALPEHAVVEPAPVELAPVEDSPVADAPVAETPAPVVEEARRDEPDKPESDKPESDKPESDEPESDEPETEPPDPEPPASGIIASPLVAPVVVTVPETAPKPPRRKWFARRDAFTRPTTPRERILARTCMWLVAALALAVLALRLPIGARPELGASTSTNGQVGTAESPITSPFADAVRVQTQADLQVVVATASSLYPVFRSFRLASPEVLQHELPQFAFTGRTEPSVRVGQLSVSAANTQIVFAEYAGPKGCAYARVVLHRTTQFFVGATHSACLAASPPSTGWRPLGQDG
jgi:hypothetical protein